MTKTFLPIIIIAISVGIYVLYIDPVAKEVSAMSQKASLQKNVLMQARELATRRDAILTDYNNIPGSDIDKLNKIVPDTFNQVIFINEISSVASSYGLSVREFKVDEPKTEIRDAIMNRPEQEIYKSNRVKLRLQGPYQQFLQFLSDLEQSLRLSDVTFLSIKPIGSSGSGSLDYVLELKTYSLK